MLIDPSYPVGDPDYYSREATYQPAEVCNPARDPDNTFAAERNHASHFTQVSRDSCNDFTDPRTLRRAVVALCSCHRRVWITTPQTFLKYYKRCARPRMCLFRYPNGFSQSSKRETLSDDRVGFLRSDYCFESAI